MIRTVEKELFATIFESEFKLEKSENYQLGNFQVFSKVVLNQLYCSRAVKWTNFQVKSKYLPIGFQLDRADIFQLDSN